MFVQQEHRIEAQASIPLPTRSKRDTPPMPGSSPRYNSLEFVYRPEFRQLVLLDQDPETGEKINQVPSEYRLKLYAAAGVPIGNKDGDKEKAGSEIAAVSPGIDNVNTVSSPSPSVPVDISVIGSAPSAPSKVDITA